MTYDRGTAFAILFGRTNTSAECRCGNPGYCPRCGSYEPATSDPEIATAINEATHPAANGGHRIIRKHIGRD